LAEDYLVERAHNEPLQIFAELGVVGFVLLITAFGTFAYWAFRTLRHKTNLPPMIMALIGGLSGFGISSLFSSFSFRAAQNGIAFAVVFGLMLRYLIKLNPGNGEKADRNPKMTIWPKLFYAVSLLGTMILLIITATEGVSRIYQYRAEVTDDLDQKVTMLQKSIYWDRNNAGAIGTLSSVMAAKGEYGPAADLLHKAINCGIGVTQVYSSLAELELRSGKPERAENTMSEAVEIFPTSVFARVRYAQMLELNGRNSIANDQTAAASAINLRQTRGWTMLLREGDLATFLASRENPNISPPAELHPSGAVLQFVDHGFSKGR
jgi:hypothetical protein